MYTTFVCLYLACLCECVVMHPSVCVSCLLLLFVCVFSLCVCVHVHSSVCLVCRTITCVLLASVCVSDYTFFCVCLVCVQCVSILKCFLLKKKNKKSLAQTTNKQNHNNPSRDDSTNELSQFGTQRQKHTLDSCAGR